MSYSKNYICKFMQAKKKIQECEYLKNEKSFLDEIKIIFRSF